MLLTPEQARELVDYFGSQRAAARATGIAQSTLSRCLHPEDRERRYRLDRAYQRERYHTDPDYRERKLASNRKSYDSEDAIQRARRLLRNRRVKALRRRAQREQRRP